MGQANRVSEVRISDMQTNDIKNRSVLLISANSQISETVSKALAEYPNVSVRTESETLANMNGSARKLAFGNDIVIVTADPDDNSEVSALRELLTHPHENTHVVAMTDGGLPLSKAMVLTRAGVDEVLPYTGSASELAEALGSTIADTARRQQPLVLVHTPPAVRGKLIAVTKARGGGGATTLAVNLAHCLLDVGGFVKKAPRNKVALIDFDLQFGNLGVYLDIEDKGTMMQIIRRNSAPDANFMNTALVRHPSGLCVLPAPVEATPLDALSSETVGGLLDTLMAEFDYVVVDMPPALVTWLEPILSRADRLLVVADSSVASVRQTRRLLDILTEDQPKLRAEVVVTRETKPMMLSHHHKQAVAALERPLSHWIPDNMRVMREAIDRGKPVCEIASGSNIAKAVKRMSALIMKERKKEQAAALRAGAH